MILDVVTFVVLIVLVVCAAFAAVKIAALPGRIAAGRGHPQSDAIRVCGWLGLLTLGLMWPLALIWAYTKPRGQDDGEVASGGNEAGETETIETLADIAGRLKKLEERMNAPPRNQGGDSP